MPFTFSTTIVLALFYAVFLSQIFLISVYYSGKICRRIEFVLDHFPADDYPKLYPGLSGDLAKTQGKRGLRIFRSVNYAIAVLGLAILAAMALSGYRPDLEGGDEIFVLAYFLLQACPLFYAELKEFQRYRLMRSTYEGKRRKAALVPRRLFDFVSPTSVGAAVLLYFAWLGYYLGDRGFGTSWEGETYFTVFGVAAMNLFFAASIAKQLYGKRANPYQAHKDQLQQIGSKARVMVSASIGISLFLVITIAVDRYGLEVFDPPLTSLYMQFCAAFGVGFLMRTLKIEEIDFEVYKEDAVPAST